MERPVTADDASNFRCVLRGLAGCTSWPTLKRWRIGWNGFTLHRMAHGQRPVSARLVNQLRDNFSDYRRMRLRYLAEAEAEFAEIMQEERALLEWSRHHLDELVRRRKLPKGG